jgi:tetrahydromethanopterin S-methyltransferase subunit G
MGLLAKARTAKEARSLMLDHDEIDNLHQRLDSIDRKITFLGEM